MDIHKILEERENAEFFDATKWAAFNLAWWAVQYSKCQTAFGDDAISTIQAREIFENRLKRVTNPSLPLA